MEDPSGVQESDVDVQHRHAKSTWANGQCVLAVPSASMMYPTFDLTLCRLLLERHDFQIPVKDFEAPLKIALDVPAVRRYMVFNSALFHFILAPVLYAVIWCAVFSTLHLYMAFTDYWLLCLSVSLVSIFLTTTTILILHHSHKGINMNLDVRLIQVNERMTRHKLLLAVADWVHNCTGTIQLFCVYWDMAHCLTALTETLEEGSETQKKLRSRMSHLVLVTEVVDPEVGRSEVGGSGGEAGPDEERPLLPDIEETVRSTASSQREDTKITTNYSLIPDTTLPAKAAAHQLLLTYSAAYVKLLISDQLSVLSPPRPDRTHCRTGGLCLCQYIQTTVLH